MNYKDQGNSLFKQEQFQQAIDQYTEGLNKEDIDLELKAILFCNIAICHARLNQDDLYLLNLTNSIETNDKYEKPLKLRAIYYYKIEKWEESLDDYKKLKENFEFKDEKIIIDLEQKVAIINEKRKKEVVDGLKDVGNNILGYFGMSLDNFKLNQNQNGSYNIQFQK